MVPHPIVKAVDVFPAHPPGLPQREQALVSIDAVGMRAGQMRDEFEADAGELGRQRASVEVERHVLY